ncbi:CBO0543 family protein [Gracilibacillus sp. YIM 98692]|uniref:CBO0543 family protein n=1 Tax=Gracilibacillus sp. YIM 98692 TaxID=2663532 RepID=UPI0013CF9335|nr:CBO0543 family protein [Gracilibacillus sp. YIM 98692]
MKEKQLNLLNELTSKQEEATQALTEYWTAYSNMGTWQFWAILIMFLVIPLIALYFTIDRSKIFLIGFYGFSVHLCFTYIDLIGARLGMWSYPYMVIPYTPGNFSFNSALIPVVFMLVYQWTINQNKNFYLYSLLTSAILSFALNPLLVSLNLLELNKGINYFHWFLIFIGTFSLSKLVTSVFLLMRKKQSEHSSK